MAVTNELPIFLDSYELLSQLTVLIPRIPRVYRFSLGSRMMDDCLNMIWHIRRANSAYGQDKLPAINLILDDHGQLEMLFRLLFEQRVITSKQYAPYMLLLTKIGKQANGWKKHYST
ncbi:MAG: four helix bundle protein [Prevotella sp.]|nr:four helix bundle protein [Prevotella sp.]